MIGEASHSDFTSIFTGWKTVKNSKILKNESIKQFKTTFNNKEIILNYDSNVISHKRFSKFVEKLDKKGLLRPFVIWQNEKFPHIKGFYHKPKYKPNTVLPNAPPLRLSDTMRKHLRAMCEYYKTKGILSPVKSNCHSQVFLVKKPGKILPENEENIAVIESCFRLVQNLIPNNCAIIYEHFMQPSVRDNLEKIRFSKIFNSFDLKSAFTQILLHPSVYKYYAFKDADDNSVVITRASQGDSTSPMRLNQILHTIFKDFKNKYRVAIYLDDIASGHSDLDDAMESVIDFLTLCNEFDISLNNTKCILFSQSAEITGWKVSSTGQSLKPRHIEALQNLNVVCKNLKDMQRLTGHFNYFSALDVRIPHKMAKIYEKMTELNKNKTLKWTVIDTNNCKDIIDLIINSEEKSFQLPEKGQPPEKFFLVISSDASKFVAACVIQQLQPIGEDLEDFIKNGYNKNKKYKCQLRLLDIVSKKFSAAQLGFSIYRKEICSLILGTVKSPQYFINHNVLKICRVDSYSIKTLCLSAKISSSYLLLLQQMKTSFRPLLLYFTISELNPADIFTKPPGTTFELTDDTDTFLERIKNDATIKTIPEKVIKKYNYEGVNTIEKFNKLTLPNLVQADSSGKMMRLNCHSQPAGSSGKMMSLNYQPANHIMNMELEKIKMALDNPKKVVRNYEWLSENSKEEQQCSQRYRMETKNKNIEILTLETNAMSTRNRVWDDNIGKYKDRNIDNEKMPVYSDELHTNIDENSDENDTEDELDYSIPDENLDWTEYNEIITTQNLEDNLFATKYRYRNDREFIKNKAKHFASEPKTFKEIVKTNDKKYHLSLNAHSNLLKQTSLAEIFDKNEVKKAIAHCKTCSSKRNEIVPRKVAQSAIQIGTNPGQTLTCDFAGPLQKSGTYKYFVVFVDNFTDYTIAAPAVSTSGTDWIQHYENLSHDVYGGIFPALRTDAASSFRSVAAHEFLGKHNTHFVSSNPRNSNAQSLAERKIRTIKEGLHRFGWHNWHKNLKTVVSTINQTKKPSLANMSPAELMFGRTFDIDKLLHITEIGEHTVQKGIRINFNSFRKWKMSQKELNLVKRNLKIGKLVKIKFGTYWSNEIYKIVRITPDSVGVIPHDTKNGDKEITRSLNDIILQN